MERNKIERGTRLRTRPLRKAERTSVQSPRPVDRADAAEGTRRNRHPNLQHAARCRGHPCLRPRLVRTATSHVFGQWKRAGDVETLSDHKSFEPIGLTNVYRTRAFSRDPMHDLLPDRGHPHRTMIRETLRSGAKTFTRNNSAKMKTGGRRHGVADSSPCQRISSIFSGRHRVCATAFGWYNPGGRVRAVCRYAEVKRVAPRASRGAGLATALAPRQSTNRIQAHAAPPALTSSPNLSAAGARGLKIFSEESPAVTPLTSGRTSRRLPPASVDRICAGPDRTSTCTGPTRPPFCTRRP